jgi:hypothetical protein
LSIASHRSSVKGFTPFTLSVKTEWDREERSFMSVAATARLEEARSSRVATDRGLLSGTGYQLDSVSESRRRGLTANHIGNSHLALFIDLNLVFLGIKLTISK